MGPNLYIVILCNSCLTFYSLFPKIDTLACNTCQCTWTTWWKHNYSRYVLTALWMDLAWELLSSCLCVCCGKSSVNTSFLFCSSWRFAHQVSLHHQTSWQHCAPIRFVLRSEQTNLSSWLLYLIMTSTPLTSITHLSLYNLAWNFVTYLCTTVQIFNVIRALSGDLFIWSGHCGIQNDVAEHANQTMGDGHDSLQGLVQMQTWCFSSLCLG